MVELKLYKGEEKLIVHNLRHKRHFKAIDESRADGSNATGRSMKRCMSHVILNLKTVPMPS